MIVSIVNGEYLFGIDHINAQETFYISNQEFNDLESGLAYIKNKEVIYNTTSKSEIKRKQKEILLLKINKLQEESLTKRLEYTTVRDMLPEGNQIREMKLQKLAYEGDEILVEFETLVKELITEYGESALVDII